MGFGQSNCSVQTGLLLFKDQTPKRTYPCVWLGCGFDITSVTGQEAEFVPIGRVHRAGMKL